MAYEIWILRFGNRVLERAINAFPVNIICSNRAGHPGLFRHPSPVLVYERVQRVHQPVHKRVKGGIKHIGQLFADTGAPGAGFQCAALLRKVLAQGRVTFIDIPGWILQLLGYLSRLVLSR